MMERILGFLQELHGNNNKVWFDAHRKEYQAAREAFSDIALQLIAGVREFDRNIGPLSLQDCTYRINRDIRFSQDKSPYKTHFGVFIAPQGKRSGYSGYYFHIGVADGKDYPDGHMLGIGNYYCEPKALKILREDIDTGGNEFDSIVHAADHRLYLDRDNALKRVPNGFESGTVNDDYLRLKNFCLCFKPDHDFIMSQDLVRNVLDIFRSGKPFIDYINRAISYSRKDNEDKHLEDIQL